ncbi:MAG: hypothetical protein K2X66_11665, partial [Cyanobacteria bacterium]|nr:hypothetical protein [Cyanobacteriota bacterium]
FRFWRFDTIGDDQSLFAQFGFQPLPTGRPGDAFGKGFLFDDTKAAGGTTGCLFEFRRGYLLASHPEHGTLVIRNSSKVFGRNLMKHPAYLLPGSLNEKQLIAFNPEQLPDGSHILNRNLYLDPVKGAKAKNRNLHDFNNENDLHLSYLTEALLSLKEEYRRFKLDTQAFEGYGSQRVFTGHLSPGFAKIVQKLNQLKQQQQPTSPLLQLAFVHPEFPIYQPYGTYPITDEHLNELNRFVQGDMTQGELENTDWIKFLSTAGVQNRAELVLITEG